MASRTWEAYFVTAFHPWGWCAFEEKSVLLTILAFYIMKNPCIEAHNN